MSTDSSVIASLANLMGALEHSESRKKPADVQQVYDFYDSEIAKLKGLSETQKRYLNSRKVKGRLLQKNTLEEFRAALNIAIAESSPEIEKAMYENLRQLKNGEQIVEQIAWKVSLEGLSPALVLASIRSIEVFGDQYHRILDALSNGYVKLEDLKYLEEIYQNLILPPIHTNKHPDFSRVELALNSIKEGLPAELIVKGLSLGLGPKFDGTKDKRWGYYYRDDNLFKALTLVHKGRVTFEDLNSLSNLDIKLMFFIEEATIDTVKAINAKCANCPLDEYDITEVIGKKDVKERMEVLNTLSEMNRDGRHYYSCGFSKDEAIELTSNGIPFEFYNDRKYDLFTRKGFKLFFLDRKMREEILRILPRDFLPEKPVTRTTPYMGFTTNRFGVRISAATPNLYFKLIHAGAPYKRKN